MKTELKRLPVNTEAEREIVWQKLLTLDTYAKTDILRDAAAYWFGRTQTHTNWKAPWAPKPEEFFDRIATSISQHELRRAAHDESEAQKSTPQEQP